MVPRSPRGWDVLATIAVLAAFAITWPTLFVTHQVADSIAPLVAAAGAAPLVLLRTQPFAGWASSAVVALMVAISLDPLPEYGFPWPVPHFLILLALLVAVALRASAREIGIMWAGTTALFLVFMPGDLRAGWAVGGTMLTVVALLVRWLVLSRRELARQEQVSELERARRAVLEERSRIARDLHDVVAHSMSLVVVQAQSAPQRLGGVTPAVQREFDSIGEQARQALNEVRGMLGVLRSDGQLAEALPQPGLEQVEPLLREARAAGMDLSWDISGSPADCGPASAMVVVRVIQESLANATRHAPGAAVSVELTYTAEAVGVVVSNGRPTARGGEQGPASAASPHGGAGIVGMRARVHALGGALTAEPQPGGGFVVRAEVPKTARVATTPDAARS